MELTRSAKGEPPKFRMEMTDEDVEVIGVVYRDLLRSVVRSRLRRKSIPESYVNRAKWKKGNVDHPYIMTSQPEELAIILENYHSKSTKAARKIFGFKGRPSKMDAVIDRLSMGIRALDLAGQIRAQLEEMNGPEISEAEVAEFDAESTVSDILKAAESSHYRQPTSE